MSSNGADVLPPQGDLSDHSGDFSLWSQELAGSDGGELSGSPLSMASQSEIDGETPLPILSGAVKRRRGSTGPPNRRPGGPPPPTQPSQRPEHPNYQPSEPDDRPGPEPKNILEGSDGSFLFDSEATGLVETPSVGEVHPASVIFGGLNVQMIGPDRRPFPRPRPNPRPPDKPPTRGPRPRPAPPHKPNNPPKPKPKNRLEEAGVTEVTIEEVQQPVPWAGRPKPSGPGREQPPSREPKTQPKGPYPKGPPRPSPKPAPGPRTKPGQ